MKLNPIQALYRLWAKTNERDEGYTSDQWTRHPLPLHLIDVGYVAETWLDADPLLLGRFCALLPGVPEKDVRRLLILTTALHDLGKIHPHFQAKSELGWKAGYGTLIEQSRPDGTGFDHGAATAALLNLFIDKGEVDDAYRPLELLLEASAAHHGRFFDATSLAEIPLRSFKSYTTQGRLMLALIEEIEYHFGSMPLLPAPPGNDFCMLAAGFISVADWIGSDKYFFQAAPNVASRVAAEGYLNRLRKKEKPAAEALRQAGLIAGFLDDVPGFASFFGFEELLPLQEIATTVPFGEAAGAEIAIIEEPMGGGKTEIAQYLAALALARRTAAGLYFALPTQASANALFERTLTFTERVAGSTPVALMLAHGARRFFKDFRELLRQSKHVPFARSVAADPNEPAPASEVIATSWLLPTRRALLAPVGLGTIDQAMLGALSVRHAFVRLFALARKVVVLDEIHAYDAYMNRVILHLLRWLRVLGAKVILLSATLPDGLRRDLLAAYDVTEPPHDARYAPYPQILHARPGTEATEAKVYRLPNADTPSEVSKEKPPVSVKALVADDVTAAGVERVLKLAKQGGCVAWIRNTVREAQEAYRQIAGQTDAEVVLLHARFIRADRNRIEEDLVGRLGKNPGSARPERLIVVATQVIEQSVDLDFDVMVSDLAPIDLLLQRSGRLHRHLRTAAVRQGHTTPRLVVLMPTAEDRRMLRYGLSAYVYDPETLARTATLLEEKKNRSWAMPMACRALVSDLYDHTGKYWTAEKLGCDKKRLDLVRERTQRLFFDKKTKAVQNLLPAPTDERLGTATVKVQPDNIEEGSGAAIATRYGDRSATITLFDADTTVHPHKQAVSFPLASDDYGDRLPTEEAIALASVSFPWYGAFPRQLPLPELATWTKWWQQHHPYDQRFFLKLNAEGTLTSRSLGLQGYYNKDEGLVIKQTDRPKHTTPSGYADQPPYEDI